MRYPELVEGTVVDVDGTLCIVTGPCIDVAHIAPAMHLLELADEHLTRYQKEYCIYESGVVAQWRPKYQLFTALPITLQQVQVLEEA